MYGIKKGDKKAVTSLALMSSTKEDVDLVKLRSLTLLLQGLKNKVLKFGMVICTVHMDHRMVRRGSEWVMPVGSGPQGGWGGLVASTYSPPSKTR